MAAITGEATYRGLRYRYLRISIRYNYIDSMQYFVLLGWMLKVITVRSPQPFPNTLRRSQNPICIINILPEKGMSLCTCAEAIALHGRAVHIHKDYRLHLCVRARLQIP